MFEMKMNNSVSEQHSKHNPNSATRSTASRLLAEYIPQGGAVPC